MKTIKGYYIAIMFLVISASLYAQDQVQAFRYSQVYTVGTARYAAMGGALGAVGGDFTSASNNPAGLGFYRSSELTISPSVNFSRSTSNYLGNIHKDSDYNLNIGNLGVVTAFNRQRDNGIVGGSFAFGYNTIQNFNSSTLMGGINSNSSLLDNFTWYANNTNQLDGFYEELAFETGLMPLDTIANTYWHDLEGVYGQEQYRIVEKRGSVGEYAFSGALNFSHKVYLGATMGIQSVRYYEDIYHTEKDIADVDPEFAAFGFSEFNNTRGTGFAFKVGVIIKPIQMLRIGASFHAPVIYSLTDEKYTDLEAEFDTNSGIEDGFASSGVYAKEYTLRSPYRFSASAAVVIGKLGMVTAEYEYVDYSSSDLDSPGYNFFDENMAISKDFKDVHNLKAGAELRLNSLYFRGGAQYYMNPYMDTRNGSNIWVYSGGLGVRSSQAFVDLSYSSRSGSELYGLYQHTPGTEDGYERSANDYRIGNVLVTLGFKF